MTAKRAALPVLKIADGTALVDAVKARGGWVAYALTGKGLRATRMARRSKQEAIRALKQERRLKGFAAETAPRKIAVPWGAFLKDALEGKRVDLAHVPLDDRGWTDFTRRVYKRAQRIPRGKTMSYRDIAKSAGSPGAARAVGQLMARNPVAPVVPCHRVVGSDGSMCGFSAEGGIETKRKMLKREKG
jgi:O-6-methylguanine DNA methyltransferase